MPSSPTSRTELLLPGVHRAMGGPLQTILAQTAEAPLFTAEATEESFIDRLLPDGAPSGWLRWLFSALGADAYWREDFDDTRRRLILRRLFELYRSKGTAAGLRLHLGLLADATLVRAVQPPAKTFLAPSLTQAERAALEAQHPEVRLRPFSQYGVKQSLFAGDCLGDPTESWAVHPAITTAGDRIGETAALYDPATAVETPLQRATVDVAGLVVRLGIRGRAVGLFARRALPAVVADQEARTRLYTYALQGGTTDPLLTRASLGARPGLLPVRVWYTPHHEPGTGRGMYAANRWTDRWPDRGGAHLPAFPTRGGAERRIWKSVRLFDPARAPQHGRAASTYCGGSRLGRVPVHVMEASISAPGHTSGLAMWGAAGAAAGRFIVASDAVARIDRMRWAGNLARRAGCRIPVATRTHIPLLTGPSVVCGLALTNDLQEVI